MFDTKVHEIGWNEIIGDLAKDEVFGEKFQSDLKGFPAEYRCDVGVSGKLISEKIEFPSCRTRRQIKCESCS